MAAPERLARSGFGFHGVRCCIGASRSRTKAEKVFKKTVSRRPLRELGTARTWVCIWCVSACESETLCISVYLFTVFVYLPSRPATHSFTFRVLRIGSERQAGTRQHTQAGGTPATTRVPHWHCLPNCQDHCPRPSARDSECDIRAILIVGTGRGRVRDPWTIIREDITVMAHASRATTPQLLRVGAS